MATEVPAPVMVDGVQVGEVRSQGISLERNAVVYTLEIWPEHAHRIVGGIERGTLSIGPGKPSAELWPPVPLEQRMIDPASPPCEIDA